jgi:hypothetical protein
MSKRSKWQSLSLAWKIIAGLSVILGLVVSIVTLLQWLGAVDFWHPLYDFLTSSVSIYYFLLTFAIILIFAYSLFRFGNRENILDWDYGRWIAESCETPRTTEYLRRKYEEWSEGILGGPNFDHYMKRLEKQGYLKYRNGKWEVTDEALDYIDKYHGG